MGVKPRLLQFSTFAVFSILPLYLLGYSKKLIMLFLTVFLAVLSGDLSGDIGVCSELTDSRLERCLILGVVILSMAKDQFAY